MDSLFEIEKYNDDTLDKWGGTDPSKKIYEIRETKTTATTYEKMLRGFGYEPGEGDGQKGKGKDELVTQVFKQYYDGDFEGTKFIGPDISIRHVTAARFIIERHSDSRKLVCDFTSPEDREETGSRAGTDLTPSRPHRQPGTSIVIGKNRNRHRSDCSLLGCGLDVLLLVTTMGLRAVVQNMPASRDLEKRTIEQFYDQTMKCTSGRFRERKIEILLFETKGLPTGPPTKRYFIKSVNVDAADMKPFFQMVTLIKLYSMEKYHQVYNHRRNYMNSSPRLQYD